MTPGTPPTESGGDKLLAEIRAKLEAFGVGNYVIAFSDPDADTDKVSVYGSNYWRLGFGQDLVDETRDDLSKRYLGDPETK